MLCHTSIAYIKSCACEGELQRHPTPFCLVVLGPIYRSNSMHATLVYKRQTDAIPLKGIGCCGPAPSLCLYILLMHTMLPCQGIMSVHDHQDSHTGGAPSAEAPEPISKPHASQASNPQLCQS